MGSQRNYYSYGYTGRILRVNLEDKAAKGEEIKEELRRKYLGGRGLAVKYLYDETPPGIDPLGEDNKLIFMTGPLTGAVPTGGFCYIAAKSPLTNIIGGSLMGGNFGAELKFAGYDGMIIEKKAEKPVYIFLDDGLVKFFDASHMCGLGVHETEEMIKDEIGDYDLKVACIGPAGEKTVRFASIVAESVHSSGRTGMGAVSGSKNLKGIAIRGTKDVPVFNPEGLLREIEKTAKRRNVFQAALSAYGTSAFLSLSARMGAFPVRNHIRSEGYHFDEEEIFSSIIKKDACFACPIGCIKVSRIPSGRYEGELSSSFGYDALSSLGGLCGCFDTGFLMKAHNMCNELGMDEISAGAVISFAMECSERGLKFGDDERAVEFGNCASEIDLLGDIANREGIGDLLADGVKKAAEKISYGSEKYAMHVKGLEIPGYDPRKMKKTALSISTSNIGADHMSSSSFLLELGFSLPISSYQGMDDEKNTPMIVKELEDWLAMTDSLVICRFYGVSIDKSQISSYLSLVTGIELTLKELEGIGERIWNLERIYNLREGLRGREDDALPDRFFPDDEEKKKFDMQIDEYYRIRGWNDEGIPKEEKIKELL